MTIHVSKDAEDAINAAVLSGQFASADEMVDRLVRDYAQRTRQHPAATHTASAGASAPAPDPILGLMRDDTELMDEIVADAYRHRREETWRDLDL
jgi:Arc/MetJ-type ribon-helix-helix transcriptional regulator